MNYMFSPSLLLLYFIAYSLHFSLFPFLDLQCNFSLRLHCYCRHVIVVRDSLLLALLFSFAFFIKVFVATQLFH